MIKTVDINWFYRDAFEMAMNEITFLADAIYTRVTRMNAGYIYRRVVHIHRALKVSFAFLSFFFFFIQRVHVGTSSAFRMFCDSDERTHVIRCVRWHEMIAKHFLKRVFRYNLRTKNSGSLFEKMFESLIPRVREREREKKHAVQCCHLVHLYRTKPPSIMQYTLLSFGDSSHTFFLLFFSIFFLYFNRVKML